MAKKVEPHRASFELRPIAGTCDALPVDYPRSPLRASTSTLDDDLNYAPMPRGAQSPTGYSVEEERAVVRKLDSHLVLFVAFLYMLSFLDRSSASVAFPWKHKQTY